MTLPYSSISQTMSSVFSACLGRGPSSAVILMKNERFYFISVLTSTNAVERKMFWDKLNDVDGILTALDGNHSEAHSASDKRSRKIKKPSLKSVEI